jgi:hypothetical protein
MFGRPRKQPYFKFATRHFGAQHSELIIAIVGHVRLGLLELLDHVRDLVEVLRVEIKRAVECLVSLPLLALPAQDLAHADENWRLGD